MDNKQLEKTLAEIGRTKEKITELQGRLRELEQKKTALENAQIVEAVRSMNIPLDELAAVLRSFQAPAAASGHSGPKSAEAAEKEGGEE